MKTSYLEEIEVKTVVDRKKLIAEKVFSEGQAVGQASLMIP